MPTGALLFKTNQDHSLLNRVSGKAQLSTAPTATCPDWSEAEARSEADSSGYAGGDGSTVTSDKR